MLRALVCRCCSCLKVVAGLVVAFVIPPLIVIRVQKTLGLLYVLDLTADFSI